MRSIETKAKTVDEAIWSGLQQLNLSRDQVRVEIIEPGSRGFLGLGAKPAQVRLTEVPAEEKISFADLLKNDLDLSMKSEPIKIKAKKPIEVVEKEDVLPRQKPIIEKVENPIISVLPKEKITIRTEKSAMDNQETIPSRQNRERTAVPDRRPLPRQEARNQRNRELPSRRENKIISNVEQEVWEIPTELAPRKAYDYASAMIQAMKLKCNVNVRMEEEEIIVNLTGDSDDLGMLIGKRGTTLDAFQYLLTIVVNRAQEERIRLTLNVGDYRKRREETLLRLALRLAAEVEQSGKSVALEPMSPRERRLIHMALQDREGVYTESSGEENYRHIVIFKRI